MQTPIANDNTAIRNDQREEARRNRMAMRGDVAQMPPARQVQQQQPELLTLVLEHLDLMNRAKRLIATPADNPRKAYFTARVVEIRDYLANVDKHIAELVQQERDELTLEG